MKTKPIVGIGILSAIVLLWSGCSLVGPIYYPHSKDADGNRPADVARLFVEAVQAGDLTKAMTYWDTDGLESLKRLGYKSFEDYCKTVLCDSFKVEAEGGDKGVHYVYMTGRRNNQEVGKRFFLTKVSGRWKM